MSEEIKELLFLLHNDRLTKAGKRKLEQEIERLNQYIDFYKDLDEKQNKELQNLKQVNEEHQKLNGELRVENERLNKIINESAEEILKELEENHHLSYGVALAIRQKLLDYKELKGDGSSE